MTFALSRRLERLETSVAQHQQKGLGALHGDVYEREEKHGSDFLYGEHHLQDDDAQLDVLATGFQADGPAASRKEQTFSVIGQIRKHRNSCL